MIKCDIEKLLHFQKRGKMGALSGYLKQREDFAGLPWQPRDHGGDLRADGGAAGPTGDGLVWDVM